MRVCALVLLTITLSASAGPQSAFAQCVHDRFDEMRQSLTRQVRSRRVEERLSALETLRRFPVTGATRLVYQAFKDQEQEVRLAAYETLLEMNDAQEVCDTLAAIARSHLADVSDLPMALPALAALLSSELPLAQMQAQAIIDRELTRSPHGAELLVALADNLGEHAQAADARPLVRLSHARLFDEKFGIRRAVVQALGKLPPEASIDALIRIMPAAGGEAKADAAAHLTRLTGQKFGLNDAAWRKWREATAGVSLSAPVTTMAQVSTRIHRAEEVPSEGGHYYGIPIYADRLVFVLDMSGSMQGGRFVAAKRELLNAIHGLRREVKFGIVVFNTGVTRWQRDLVLADPKNKRAAEKFIENLNPQASTNTYDALDAAMEYEVEAIYFLTDGAPTCGKIVAPVDIVTAVTGSNRTRRISIYTIGIAPGFSGSPTDTFLKSLAEENLGTYRRVDG
jgi:hypothetical protein